MNRTSTLLSSLRYLALITICIQILDAASVTQSLSIAPGWNSVWLSVEPTQQSGDDLGNTLSVEEVFTEIDITIVSQHAPSGQTIEYVSDLSEQSLTREFWKTWWRESPIESSNLSLIYGGRGYLIYNDGSATLNIEVTGQPVITPVTWESDSYNLIGFSLNTSMTFDTALDAAGDHFPINQIFQLLSDGSWVGVQSSDLIESDTAYWFYCDGPSTFNGPLQFSDRFNYSIDFGNESGDIEVADPDGGVDSITISKDQVTLSNLSASSVDVTVTKVTTDSVSETQTLRLYQLFADADSLDYTLGSLLLDDTVLTLPAQSTDTVLLAADRNWTYGDATKSHTYQISAGGFNYWFTASATHPTLDDASSQSDDSAYTGLWIGEVILNQVTDLTTDGRPVSDTTNNAPIRIILHVDDQGAVSLLSNVLLMKKEAADEDSTPEDVLVIDESKIPYFTGVQLRGGKEVGLRIDTIAYDMPRKVDITTQAALLQFVVDASSTDDLDAIADVADADILDYLNSRSARPVDLVDDYYTAWPLDGGLGEDALIETANDAPLHLDPFHRTNPFKHSYHPKHAAGYGIERALSISLTNNSAGRFTGTYQEILSGLSSADITLQGTITLEHVSDVSELQ